MNASQLIMGGGSSEDTTYSSTLIVSNISTESLSFDFSKDSTTHSSRQQEGIASIEGERRLELGNEHFYLMEKNYGSSLPLKKRVVFFESGSVSTSSPICFLKKYSELSGIQHSVIVESTCKQSC